MPREFDTRLWSEWLSERIDRQVRRHDHPVATVNDGQYPTRQIDATSGDLLTVAKADAEAFDVPIETKTILSHRGLEEVFDAARSTNADTVVMGYGGVQFAGGRAEGALEELTHNLPRDFPRHHRGDRAWTAVPDCSQVAGVRDNRATRDTILLAARASDRSLWERLAGGT